MEKMENQNNNIKEFTFFGKSMENVRKQSMEKVRKKLGKSPEQIL